MKSTFFKTGNIRYRKSAQRAIAAEQSGDFESASLYWINAGNAASNPANRAWAAVRMEFCDNAHARGWGQHDAGSGI
ncbi:ANR family transcriptional regulator [Pantoea sp. VS1]|uniref:ANR family transcriptional regulator n=1 Tax=Pantoea sp. VS1 TaxID=2003658 RepID=UPI0034E8DEBC